MTRTQLHKVALYTLPSMMTEMKVSFEQTPVTEEHVGGQIPLFNQLPGMIWMTDAGLCLTALHGAQVAQLRLLPSQAVGMHVSEVFPQDASRSVEAVHCGALGGHAMGFEFCRGNVLFHGVVEPLFDTDGTLVGTIGLAVDITERQTIEADRFQLAMKELEARREDILRRLTGGVAHNFNNLLTVVLGYTSLAMLEAAPDSPLHRNLTQVEMAAQAAAELAAQMNLFAQNAPAALETLQLSKFIEQLEPLFKAAVSPKVALKLDLVDPAPAIEADRLQLRRLILTLVFNASEAIGDEFGIIRLRTQVIHADQSFLGHTFADEKLPEGDYMWLQISDTGCGMDEETRSRVFEPFFSTKFTGRGLGLAAALGIVRAHHGAIAVSSKPGLGSTFHVLLPLAVQTAERSAATSQGREHEYAGTACAEDAITVETFA